MKGTNYRGTAASDGENLPEQARDPPPGTGPIKRRERGELCSEDIEERTMGKTCKILGCEKLIGVPGTAWGFCSMHYSRWLRNGDPHIRSKRVYLTHQPCTVEGCDCLIAGRGLCATHWMQWKRRGDPCAPLLRGRPWSERDVKRLEMILDRAPDGLGWALPGEAVHAAIILERTVKAVCSKLGELRKARRLAQNVALMAPPVSHAGPHVRRG